MAHIKAKLEVQGYNNGELVKKQRWVGFPITDESFMQEVMKLTQDEEGTTKLPSYAKRMVRIVEWEVPSFLESKFEEKDEVWAVDFEKVNDYAEDLKEISEKDMRLVEAMLDEGSWSVSEAISIVCDEAFRDFRDDDVEDIVRKMATEECRYIPDYILDNVDYNEAFEDMKDDMCGTWLETDDGWVYIE